MGYIHKMFFLWAPVGILNIDCFCYWWDAKAGLRGDRNPVGEPETQLVVHAVAKPGTVAASCFFPSLDLDQELAQWNWLMRNIIVIVMFRNIFVIHLYIYMYIYYVYCTMSIGIRTMRMSLCLLKMCINNEPYWGCGRSTLNSSKPRRYLFEGTFMILKMGPGVAQYQYVYPLNVKESHCGV